MMDAQALVAFSREVGDGWARLVRGARNRGAATCTIVWIFPTDTYSEIEYIDV